MDEQKNSEPIITLQKFYPNEVYGKSIIDHRIAAKTGLSLSVYCAMLYFAKIAKANFFTLPTDAELWKNVAIEDAYACARYLVKREFLIRIEKGKYKITEKWNSLFKDKMPESEFEDEVWPLYKKHGNKQEAKRQYIKARQIASKDEIIAGIIRYNNHLADPKYSWKNRMIGSRFFNPTNKHWEDIYESIKEKKTYRYSSKVKR